MTNILIFCLIVVMILAICFLIVLSFYDKLRKHYQDLQTSYHSLEKLNMELRTQRHDYLNHLQVVYGLLELKEYEELYSYLSPVYKNIQKTGKALKTSKPAINALLKAKMDEAESKNIDFYIEVKTDLKNLQVEDWELCKVFSNLIDNAITALEEKEEDKKIRIDMTEDREYYLFSVSNNGPMILHSMQEEIFKPGVTTKKESGHGMGLHIVQTVIKAYKGKLNLSSKEEETTFSFYFPKEERR